MATDALNGASYRLGPLVGRARQVALAENSLNKALAGHGGVVLICGEPMSVRARSGQLRVRTGLVVVVDMQWADRESALLLTHLGREVSSSRLLALVTPAPHTLRSKSTL